MSSDQLLVYPIMGLDYSVDDFKHIDLSITNPNLPPNPTVDQLSAYVDQFRKKQNVQWAIGGYRERRNLYQSSPHFDTDRRDIHLGVDIWGPAGSPIYLPMDGVVHSYAYNDQLLDYGYTLIMQHEAIFTLYGHLSASHFKEWAVGKAYKKGTHIANFGTIQENGGWPPHLHFQCMIELNDTKGDYPGVCSEKMSQYYFENCPDPMRYINKRP